MNSQSNQSPEMNRVDSSEGPMTGEDRLAEVPARLNELLERGEISPEAYAEYAAVADAALSSSTDSSPRMREAEIADSARRELATDVAARGEPANIQEAENPHG
jgi:hypothetical protein